MSKLIFAAALCLSAGTVVAQVPNASAAGFGMAGAYTAVARGSDALAWNPANLGLDNPSFSLNLFSGGGTSGLYPVKLADLAGFQGKVLPVATKEGWLNAIGGGAEHGAADAGLSLIAMSIDRVAFQLGMSATGRANLNQDAAEAILFGNAGRTGTAKNLSFKNSNATGSAFAIAAVGVGVPIVQRDDWHLTAGVAGKYVRGLGTLLAMDNGSSVAPSSINVDFPIVYTDSANLGSGGSGIGVDVGLAWGNQNTTISAAAKNVVNTFTWSTDALRSRAGSVAFDGVTSTTTFDETAYANAPACLRNAIDAQRFKPELDFGIAHRVAAFTLSADAGQRLGDGIDLGPKMHAGAGLAFAGIPGVILRGGAAAVTGGFQTAAGVALHVGKVELGLGISSRTRDGGQELGAMVNVLSIR